MTVMGQGRRGRRWAFHVSISELHAADNAWARDDDLREASSRLGHLGWLYGPRQGLANGGPYERTPAVVPDSAIEEFERLLPTLEAAAARLVIAAHRALPLIEDEEIRAERSRRVALRVAEVRSYRDDLVDMRKRRVPRSRRARRAKGLLA